MSTTFLWGRYQSVSDPSAIYRIKVGRNTPKFSINGVLNSFPTGAVNQKITAKSSLKKKIGVHPPFVEIIWDGKPPDGYKPPGRLWLSLLNSNICAEIEAGGPLSGVYIGKAVHVITYKSEIII